MSDPHHRRQVLAAFLRNRRERLTPADVGLPVGGARRTAGLRRAEVAVLAGVSTSWYTYLEQGREVNPSRDVLDSLATTLRLSSDERRYLHELAGQGLGTRDPGALEPGLVELLRSVVEQSDASPYPAYACDRSCNLLAWNKACTDWYGDWDALGPEPNFMVWLLTDPVARRRLVDWTEVTRDVVARWRRELGRPPYDELIVEKVGRLAATSSEFAEWWSDHEVMDHQVAVRRFQHDDLGSRSLRILPMTLSHITVGIVFHVPV